jgi:hypothetical protein
MKRELEQTSKALAKKQVELDMLEEEEKRRRNRIVTLPMSSYRYADKIERYLTRRSSQNRLIKDMQAKSTAGPTAFLSSILVTYLSRASFTNLLIF